MGEKENQEKRLVEEHRLAEAADKKRGEAIVGDRLAEAVVNDGKAKDHRDNVKDAQDKLNKSSGLPDPK